MTKLCPRGKAAAKRKFKVYPSAYANAYASKICAGKIKDPSGVKRKDFRGSKAEGGPAEDKRKPAIKGPIGRLATEKPRKKSFGTGKKDLGERKKFKTIDQMIQEQTRSPKDPRTNRAGGGLMEATARLKRQGLRGGGICTKGMNRDTVGKNS